MRVKSLIWLAVAAPVFVLPAGKSLADAGTEFLQQLAGTWKGRGIMQTKPEAKPEAVICRFKSRLSQNGRRIENSGQCAGAQAKVKVAGYLSYNAATGKFTGRMLSTGSKDDESSSSGSLAGNSLRMKIVRFDTRQNVISRGTVVVTPTENAGLTLEATETMAHTNRTFVSSHLKLRRR